ncbi:HNH endonuclease [Leptolyngbya sp. AN10]
MNSKQKHSKKSQLLRRFGSLCWWCQCSFSSEQLTLDHLIPKSQGGSNSLENLRLACFPCNHDRGNSLYPPKKRKKCTNF